MNIFITGARGFIGTAFLNAVKPSLGAGDTAYCLSRTPPAGGGPGVAWIAGDPASPGTFRKELMDSDYVVHIAGEPDLAAGPGKAAVNHLSTRELLSVLKESGRIKKFVFISSIAAAGRDRGAPIAGPMRIGEDFTPGSAYGRSKRMAEQETYASGIPFTVIRPCFVYGAGMRPGSHINRFVSLAVRNSPLARLRFPGRLPLIHVDDLAAAMLAALRPGAPSGKTYFALTETRTAGEIFALIRDALAGGRGPGLPVPGINGLPGFIRALFPPGAMALLSDYFWAEDKAFSADLLGGAAPRRIDLSIWDVIGGNPDYIRRGGAAAGPTKGQR